MSTPKQWHREAAKAHYRGINPATAHRIDELAQLIADHEPAPSSSTDQELVEKVVDKISFLAANNPTDGIGQITVSFREAVRGLLTRFLSEARRDVDVDRVWDKLVDRHGGGSVCKSITINDLADALKAAQGEK